MRANRWQRGLSCGLVCVLLAAAAPVAMAASGIGGWLAAAAAAKASQPQWMTPLVTVTPRLEQEVRYDQIRQTGPAGRSLDNFDGAKGLELIPAQRVELIVGVPAYEVRSMPGQRTAGWGDESLLMKYRLLSSGEPGGDYVVSGFLGLTLPTGSAPFSAGRAIATPTVAAGKGWGSVRRGLDVQSTLGIGIPLARQRQIGTTLAWNTSLQAHVLGKLWPEIEASYSAFSDGPHAGQRQWLLTAGVILGRINLSGSAKLVLGAGYQWPVSAFRLFDNRWLGTVRVAF